jgi:hypothetical protein
LRRFRGLRRNFLAFGCVIDVMELEDAWFAPAACHRHPAASATACERCGTFCCEGCLDVVARSLCQPCAGVEYAGTRRREALSIALKLAVGPALVAVASLWSLAHQRTVPLLFAVWLVPMICAYVLVRTERPGVAWLGASVSIALLLWFAAGVAWAGQSTRLIDVLMLSIAPLVALPGCVRLTRVVERQRFTR